MSKPRGSEMPQWRSVRGPQPKTSSSDSDPPLRHHRRVTTDRKPKLDQKSPRSVQSDPVNKKRLGTRIADVETQLGLAQQELKILKEQLASAEAAKVQAQEQLEKKCENPTAPDEIPDNHPSEAVQETKERERDASKELETPDENQPETDVFEVPMQKVNIEEEKEEEATPDFIKPTDQEDHETELEQPRRPTFDDLALKDEEILQLKAKLEEKAKELEITTEENQTLRQELSEATRKISECQAKEEQITSELNKVEQELKDSKTCGDELKEKLEIVEREKQELEDEMKKMKIQTEQWRKAADAAAAVLSGDAEMNGRRISERCGSMDKHVVGSYFEPGIGRYRGFVESPGFGDESDEESGGGKKRGHGMKMFGDLWKKKGHK